MQWQTKAMKAGPLAALLLLGCEPGQEFCSAESIVCEGDGCADAGTPLADDCITFEQAAALERSGARGVHKLSVTVAPPRFGFVTARATDTRSICKEDTCYLYTGGSAAIYAVPETQALFVGWSGCSTSTAPQLTVSATGKDLQCSAQFAAAFIVLQASSTGWADAPIGVTSSTGCDSTNGCVVFYGGSFTLTAPTSSDYQFVGWSGCATGKDPVLVLPNVTGPLPACVAQYQPVAPAP